MTLASIPLIAQTMTQLPGWSPVLKTGRGIERTILGPAFCVTSIPDLDIFFDQQLVLAPAEPEAANTLFRNVDTLPRNEASFSSSLPTESLTSFLDQDLVANAMLTYRTKIATAPCGCTSMMHNRAGMPACHFASARQQRSMSGKSNLVMYFLLQLEVIEVPSNSAGGICNYFREVFCPGAPNYAI